MEGYKFKVNLICLPLHELDVILGMDWIFTNHFLKLWSREDSVSRLQGIKFDVFLGGLD